MGSEQHEFDSEIGGRMSQRATGLRELVEALLMPQVAHLGFRVVSYEQAKVFDNAMVVAQGHELRVRVVRERGEVFVDFGSTAQPAVWFDSSVVMEYLGLRGSDGWHSSDAQAVLSDLGGFIAEHVRALEGKFALSEFAMTRKELVVVRERQDIARWGPHRDES